MRKSFPFVFSIAFSLMLCVESCVYHDFPEHICNEDVSFVAAIRPIIETKCAISGCHNGDMGPGLNWMNFDQFHARAQSGLVKFRVTNHIMPPSYSPAGPLTQEQINTIACWADQGAVNN